ncbi:hypothetical protein N7507_008586 [Penicillium longicatenatum]|nr:hypothetical protein N7507_008586 [Penicillium longicatenatum]
MTWPDSAFVMVELSQWATSATYYVGGAPSSASVWACMGLGLLWDFETLLARVWAGARANHRVGEPRASGTRTFQMPP